MRSGMRRWRGVLLRGLACALALAWPALAPARADAPVRFGILPIGSAAESRAQWRPLLDDLARELGRPVTMISVASYAGLSDAIGRQRVDVAFLSGRLAVEAVSRQRMTVVAQFVRSDGARGNHALLIVRDDGPVRGLDDLLAHPGRWRYGRGEPLSVTGYIAPEAEVFAPRGLNSDTFFASVKVDNHQNNALAVANGEIDVAAGNNPDLDLFRRHFPHEAAHLKSIWASSPIPCGVLVVRDGLDGALRERLAAFLRGYGHAPGAAGARARRNLARIPDLAEFAPAGNDALRPFVDLQYALLREQAAHGHWVSEEARAARLAQVELEHQRSLRALLGR